MTKQLSYSTPFVAEAGGSIAALSRRNSRDHELTPSLRTFVNIREHLAVLPGTKSAPSVVSRRMPGRRDPKFTTGHLCRFCGELVPWGEILRVIRVDPDTPGFMLNESACHSDCLRKALRPEVALTFRRHWNGRAPYLDDSADIDGKPCAMCARDIAPADLVRLRIQKPAGPVKQPQFDEQSLPVHAACLASVSNTRFS